MTRLTLRRYRKEAPDTIEKVESKIDAWAHRSGIDSSSRPLKTFAPSPRPASESIVAPHRETVLRLVAQGEGHLSIHEAITKEGFSGCANAGYQYLLKDAREQTLASDLPSEARPEEGVDVRPPRIGLIRIARASIYRQLLHEVAQQRVTLQQARAGLAPVEKAARKPRDTASVPAPWVNTTGYDDHTAAIIFDTHPKVSPANKALSTERYAHLAPPWLTYGLAGRPLRPFWIPVTRRVSINSLQPIRTMPKNPSPCLPPDCKWT